MDNPSYVTLSRQTGLLKNLDVIANNIANMSTTGFCREGAIFTEIVERLSVLGGSSSQSGARARMTDFGQAALRATGGAFDLAIEGEGFFLIESEAGPGLTRAGAFVRNSDGDITTADGRRLLDAGEAPAFIPADAWVVAIATDGTISADGQPIGQVALVTVEDLSSLTLSQGGAFTTDQPLIPAENASIFHGCVEGSNVDPVRELTRMIEVQRAYEMGQTFLSNEDERMREVVRVIGAA
jgi:flagellar basal-body rod protein FlgF